MSDKSSLPWEFKKERAVLLIIDMQNDFVKEGAVMEVPMARQVLPNIKILLEVCRKNKVPAVFTKQILFDDIEVSPLEVAYIPVLKKNGLRPGTSGVEVIPELAPLPNEKIIEKHRYDAFYNTRLETVLRNLRGPNVVDTVIIAGTVTNICCESTARAAFMRDFKVVFVSDANGGLDETSHNATLTIMSKAFGRVMSTKELINEIEK